MISSSGSSSSENSASSLSSSYFDQDKLHVLDHKGEYYSVRGPLHVAPSPQGRPIIVVATASIEGIDLAGEIADVVFAQQQELNRSQQFYKALKDKALTFGREPDTINFMPGFNPIVGASLQEAQDKFEFLRSKIHPDVGRAMLSVALGGFDVSDLPLDEPLPAEVDSFITEGSPSTLKMVVRMAREERSHGSPTLRALCRRARPAYHTRPAADDRRRDAGVVRGRTPSTDFSSSPHTCLAA